MFGGVGQSLLLRRTCAFSLVKVKVLFSLYIEEELSCTATHESKALISLESFSSVSFLVVKVAFETKRRFFSNAHIRSPTIFSFASYHQQHTNTKKIYIYIYIHNNAAFPRAIP